MLFRRVLRSRAASIVSMGALAAAVVSCSREPVAAPRLRADAAAPMAGKSTTALAVTSVNPPFGDQGTTVDVHVFGSGFTSGAQATWLLHGVADPAHVRTNSTTFVSSSELVANITIANDAQLDFWDVQVALLGGKNGVGSECFEVTSAQILGAGTVGGDAFVNDMNEGQQVTGYSQTGGAFVYDDAVGMLSLGAGQAWSVDPLGTLVAGSDSTFTASAWVRQSPTTWILEQLPQLPQSTAGRVKDLARASDGTLLAAGFDTYAASAKPHAEKYNRVVLWRRSGDVWSVPETYTLPAGSLRGAAYAVNGRAQIVGILDGGPTGAVWENPTSSTRLDGIPRAINAAGNLIVGERNSVPVYWWRDASTDTWNPTGVPLPSIAGSACASGSAKALNGAGVIVGESCNTGGKTQATVWLLDVSGSSPALVGAPALLPGLGLKNSSAAELSSAASVTEAAPYVVTGSVLSRGSVRLAVRWQLR